MTDKHTRKSPESRDTSHGAPTDGTYAPTATDVFELSTHLGPATRDDVRLLTAGYTDVELVALGNDYATPRVTGDALRVLGVAAAFFEKAPEADRDHVDLTIDVVRVGAWAACEGARANESLRSKSASARARDAGSVAEAEATLERARNEKKKLADLIGSVGQRSSTAAAITHALAPGAHGETSSGPEVSLSVLVNEGRALLASNDKDIKRRAQLYRLTAARLDRAETLAKEAKAAAKVLDAPRVSVTQENVDWWDGAAYAILLTVVHAFQGAHATNPRVPSVDFVSLRKRAGAAAAAAKPPAGGGEAKGGGDGKAGGGT